MSVRGPAQGERRGQVTKLEIDLDTAAGVRVNDPAYVSCSAAWGGTATVTAVVGNTVTVEFSPALPCRTRHTA